MAQPTPAVRTNSDLSTHTTTSTISTMSSTSTTSSSPASPPARPSATTSLAPHPDPHPRATSSLTPTEQSFFGALHAKVRDARSRSRSRSKSPMPPPRSSSPASPGYSRSAAHEADQSRKQRPPATDLWHGRHSNSWLFNDFSVTERLGRLRKREG